MQIINHTALLWTIFDAMIDKLNHLKLSNENKHLKIKCN